MYLATAAASSSESETFGIRMGIVFMSQWVDVTKCSRLATVTPGFLAMAENRGAGGSRIGGNS
jgi:hypothetical protein